MLAVNWFGDSLDGTVARVRGHQRPRYGYYLDHAVDLVNATALFTGMAFSGLMDPRLGLALLLGYVLLCAESFLATHAVGVFRISFSGIGPTELRILLSIGALVGRLPADRDAVRPRPRGALRPRRRHHARRHGHRLRGISTWRNARTLYLAEPLPPAPRDQVSRAARFVWVGVGGFVVQGLALHGLAAAGLPYPLATALAVEAAILHNFLWHERWTWADRVEAAAAPARQRPRERWPGSSASTAPTALVSIGGNVGADGAPRRACSTSRCSPPDRSPWWP